MFARFKGMFSKLAAFLFSDGGAVIRNAIANTLEALGPVAAAVLMAEAQRKVASLDGVTMPNDRKRSEAEMYLRTFAARAVPAATESMVEFAVLAAVRALRP